MWIKTSVGKDEPVQKMELLATNVLNVNEYIRTRHLRGKNELGSIRTSHYLYILTCHLSIN